MKTYKVTFYSSDGIKKTTEVVAESKKQAIQIAKSNYIGYKKFR